MSRESSDLLSALPQKVQDDINDVGRCDQDICDNAENYIYHLQNKLAIAKQKKRDQKKEFQRVIKNYEQDRPHWAMGYTDDSIAAQCSSAALSSLWELLGIDSQTLAMQKLPELLEEHARMLKVLTRFGEKVTAHHDLDADLSFKCNQGSESREYDYGRYCGRTDFANDLYNILMEKES